MPYTQPHILLTVQGDAYSLGETWQFGVRCRSSATGGLPSPSDLQLLADAMAAPTQTMYTNTQMYLGAGLRLTTIKAASVLETGKYPSDSQPGIYTYPAPVASAGTNYAVPQATMAVTLLTERPRGRASRGRFFLPPVAPVLAVDGRISPAHADGMEAQVKIWLNAIKATAQVEEILVMSKLDAGTTGVVGTIGVGRVIDTMRSRRRSLVEGRTPLAL